MAAAARRWAGAVALAVSVRDAAGDLMDAITILSSLEAGRDAKLQEQASSGKAPLHRFCGVAMSPDGQNGFGAAGLDAMAAEAGQGKVWHYNWGLKPSASAPGIVFVPMIKFPGEDLSDLPKANVDGVGHVVKGWNEPDDPGQAGRSKELRTQPESYAKQWVSDMQAAQAKGYTQFVAPAIAHDTVWLDFFLKGCENESGCKETVTYLSCHRYHNDCKTYEADPDNMGWRDDLSYLLTMYRLMKKYNARGFNIKGIVMDELGCLAADYYHGAPEEEEIRYVHEFYRDTIVAVKSGDATVEEKIRKTPWIMPRGPDAHAPGAVYEEGKTVAVDGGPTAGDDAVTAIKSLVSVAWFSQWPGQNDLLRGSQELSALGREYLEACKRVDAPVASA